MLALFSFAGHDFGGEDPFAGGYDFADETAEERVAREAAEAQAQRTAREGEFTFEGGEEERKATPTPSENQAEDDQPPTKKPRLSKKAKVRLSSRIESTWFPADGRRVCAADQV